MSSLAIPKVSVVTPAQAVQQQLAEALDADLRPGKANNKEVAQLVVSGVQLLIPFLAARSIKRSWNALAPSVSGISPITYRQAIAPGFLLNYALMSISNRAQVLPRES